MDESGPIISFNVLKPTGEFYRPGDIFRLLQAERIIIRSGCFCNLGSCMESLELSSHAVKSNFLSGHSCGDEIDLDKCGRPQAALRVSLGYHSSRSDVEKFLSLFQNFISSNLLVTDGFTAQASGDNSTVKIASFELYPLKSAGPARVQSISFDQSGAPLCDRIFSIVSTKSGQILSAKHFPKLSMIRTNLNSSTLTLSCPGLPSLPLDLSSTGDENENVEAICETRVCLRRVAMRNCGVSAADWVGGFLDHSVKVLKIIGGKDGLNLHMKSPLLLITTASIEWLQSKLRAHNVRPMSSINLAQRFRANIQLATSEPFVEEGWKRIRIGNVMFNVSGNCTRCGAVCTNHVTGQRESEPLKTLTQSRDRTQFGIYITPCLTESTSAVIKSSDSVEVFLS